MSKLDSVNKFLKSKSTGIGLLLSSVLNICLSLIIFFNNEFFIESVSLIIIAYFLLQFLLQILNIFFSITKGIKSFLGNIVQSFISIAIGLYLVNNLTKVWSLIPLVMSVWALFSAIASIVSFWQYRKEVSTAPIRYLISAIINFVFGIGFITNLSSSIPLSVTVLGIYLLLIGLSNFTDAVSSMLNNRQKARLKSRVRIAPPPYLTALIPISVLNSINEYLLKEQVMQEDMSILKTESVPNVEVFVHVSPYGPGQMGHVDIAIKDRVISFGGYDMSGMKLGGMIGTGVLFENFEKEEYIKFCQQESDKTLFGFGLLLRESEIMAILEHLEEIKQRGYIWKCDAQIASEKGEDPTCYNDYASKLYLKTGATYYKFKTGSFKYYWVLGTNCVKLADELLSSCGLDTLATGVITPGTYYNYLNNEFKREGSRVVKRTIYHTPESK